MQRLKQLIRSTLGPELQKDLKLKNSYQIPRVTKIVLNQGLGDASHNSKGLSQALEELSMISGQKGVVTRSKKAISAFKLRRDVPVGATVVLRGNRMYAFLDRFICLSLPRVRDFRGIKNLSFDGHGNYSMGVNEQLMFPEIHFDNVKQVRGMDINIVTSTKSDYAAQLLLKGLGLPFKTNEFL